MFEHSIRVPRLYKTAANIAKKVRDDGASVKGLVFEKKHPNIKAIYALVVETLQRSSQIDFILKKSELLVKEERFDPWLARVLITELLWGKKKLSGESKPIKTILAYQQIFNAHSTDAFEGPNKLNKVYKPRYVRVNTLSIPVQEAVDGFRDEGWTFLRNNMGTEYEEFLSTVTNLNEDEFLIDMHIKELLIFPNNTQFYKHNAYLDGSIILQDKASCLPVHILNPSPNSTVLDMCAAPGMKTTQIAALLQNQGTVYAVEIDLKRLQILNKLVDSAGATCVKTINKDVLMLNGEDIANVEYILVDPSCSGSGILDRVELESFEGKDEYRLEKLAGFQRKILKHALNGFPDAKRVVYSTCSIHPEENEAVVKEVLFSTTRFKLVHAHKLLNGPWFNFGSPDYGEIGSYCIYAKPEVDLTNGFFVAVFERLEEGEVNIFLEKDFELLKNNRKKRNDGENNLGFHQADNNFEDELNDESYTGNRINETAENEDDANKNRNKKKKKYASNNDLVEDDVDDKLKDVVICKKKSYAGDQKNEIAENEDGANKNRNKKKKKGSLNNEVFEDDEFKDIEISKKYIDTDDAAKEISSKLKKHKKKHNLCEEKSAVVDENEVSIIEKKTKKKLVTTDEIVADESTTSSKKKKNKERIELIDQEIVCEEIDIIKKKKKSKKHNANKLDDENSINDETKKPKKDSKESGIVKPSKKQKKNTSEN